MAGKETKSRRTQWIGIGTAAALTLMLGLTINYGAFSALSKESKENERLEKQIQNVTTENLGLQEQIHFLKHDPATVEREVKKFGLRRPKQKVSVPTDR